MNQIIIGKPGTGKTRNYFLPKVDEWNGTALIFTAKQYHSSSPEYKISNNSNEVIELLSKGKKVLIMPGKDFDIKNCEKIIGDIVEFLISTKFKNPLLMAFDDFDFLDLRKIIKNKKSIFQNIIDLGMFANIEVLMTLQGVYQLKNLYGDIDLIISKCNIVNAEYPDINIFIKYSYPYYIEYHNNAFVLQYPDLDIEIEGTDVNKLIEDGIKLKNNKIKEMYINGEYIPLPAQKYSGEFRLRIPKSLHQKLSMLANKEGVSLNQFIVYKLAKDINEPLNRKEPFFISLANRIKEILEQAQLYKLNNLTLREIKTIIDNKYKEGLIKKETYDDWKSCSDSLKLQALLMIRDLEK